MNFLLNFSQIIHQNKKTFTRFIPLPIEDRQEGKLRHFLKKNLKSKQKFCFFDQSFYLASNFSYG